VIRTIVVALLVAAGASTARAQDVSQYLALAREYAAGQGTDAEKRLAVWSPDDVTAAAAGAAVTGSVRDLMAVAMLHTELANTIIDTQPQLAEFHLKSARAAFTVASDRTGEREHLEPLNAWPRRRRRSVVGSPNRLRSRELVLAARGGSETMIRTVIAALLAAQTAPPPPQMAFRSRVEIVALDVSVTKDGAPVAGLTARDFALTDNGAAQDVESVTLEELPLSITLVLDASQSVAGDRLSHLVHAGEALTTALRQDDRAALITFSHMAIFAYR
jgi:hypothetical protein